jgi:hypothetical protein
MELTKEQLQYIDHSLKTKGIKYWDLRIEMIDHIVSDIEKNSLTSDFKSELSTSLKRIGWFGKLKSINEIGWKNTNKKYRREYAKGILHFLKSTKNLLILAFTFFTLYLITNHISFKAFKNFSLLLFILPIFFFLFHSIKQIGKKYGRSVNLDYGLFYFLFTFLIINMPIQFLNDASEVNQKWILIILIPIYFIATFSGFKVYKKAINRVEKMQKELLS